MKLAVGMFLNIPLKINTQPDTVELLEIVVLKISYREILLHSLRLFSSKVFYLVYYK